MQILKEKQFIIFKLDDGKTVSYDLEKKETIGKRGKPVNSLQSQLRGYKISDVIESFEDENYRNFLNFIKGMRSYDISSAASLIENAKRYARYEQYFSAGIKRMTYDFKTSITDVPKGLLKICRDYDVCLTNDVFEVYKTNPDYFTIAFSLDFTSLSTSDIIDLLTNGYYRNTYNNNVIQSILNRLQKPFSYNIKHLLMYFDNIKTFEGIDDIDYLLREFYDYVTMMSKISQKFEKYPKTLLTTHRIACRNYNRLKEQFIEEDFNKRIDKDLEYAHEEYKIIYPNSTQEIKDEAVQQNNCVASYIKRVISGDCHILFLRKKDYPEKSLVTLEFKDGKVVQARGKFNREVSDVEQKIIDKYNSKLLKKENII